MRLRRLIHGRVDPADQRQLQQEAAARGISMTACVGDILREYFALRVEMASAVTSPGQHGERHAGLIHSLLARSEERLRATLEARTTELADRLQRLEIMVDGLVRFYLVHTPEVPPEDQASADASAIRRYGKYQRFVSARLPGRDLAANRRGDQRAGENRGEGLGPAPGRSAPASDSSGGSAGSPGAS